MANYTNGTATISGNRETIKKLEEALSLLDEGLAYETGYDADDDWLPHIFKGGEVTGDGVFYEGGGENLDGSLDVYYRVKSGDGLHFFQFLAETLGLVVSLKYTNDYDEEESFTEQFIPKSDKQTRELYSRKDLEGDNDDSRDAIEADSNNDHYATPERALHGMNLFQPWGCQSTEGEAPASIRNDASDTRAVQVLVASMNVISMLMLSADTQEKAQCIKISACKNLYVACRAMQELVSSVATQSVVTATVKRLYDNVSWYTGKLAYQYTKLQPNDWRILPEEFCIAYTDFTATIGAVCSMCKELGGAIPQLTEVFQLEFKSEVWI